MTKEMNAMRNPLLDHAELPEFSKIKPQFVESALDRILADNRGEIESLLSNGQDYSWDNLIQPLEEIDNKLSRMWSTVGHLNAVKNSKDLREVYHHCLPKLSEYVTEIGHNQKLYEAVLHIANSEQFKQLDTAQQKVINDHLRDFKLAGVALSADKKKVFKQLQKQLSELTTQFEDNILDATQGWTYLVTDEKELAGIPEHSVMAAKELANRKDKTGWLFTLEFPSFFAVITYADSREFRQKMHEAFVTRASDAGPNAGRWDNSDVMIKILGTREKIAKLLGFDNYATLSLATKMAEKPDEVLSFIQQLVKTSKKQAENDYAELQEFAKKTLNLEALEPWDLPFASEKLRQERYAISQEELRPYFPEDQVLSGLFAVMKKLYGISVTETKDVDTWHENVRFFELRDEANKLRGKVYIDLYARENKRGGAWMDEYKVRLRFKDGNLQDPVAFVTCNFNSPVDDEPALFTHEEVITLFHEFGHGLQHLLTQIDYADVSGINGVPWDAVEFPSQFFENWCWQKPALDLIAKHYKTGEALPVEMFDKLIAAKNFQAAMQMLRQLEFSLFDFRLHMEFDENKKGQVQQILDEVRAAVSVVPVADYNRFQHGFSHIFAGGYAAGYYSYKWAEVLASDAFGLFEENGIFDEATGRKFLKTILETGGSQHPMELFVEFRGRKPSIDALLKQSGILT